MTSADPRRAADSSVRAVGMVRVAGRPLRTVCIALLSGSLFAGSALAGTSMAAYAQTSGTVLARTSVRAIAPASGAPHAQTSGPAGTQTSNPANLGIDRFGLGDGLPGLFIPDMAITRDGMLWLSVSGMLVSFDGQEFETHDLWSFGATDPTLRDIAAGRGDTLWVILGRQLFSFVGGTAALRADVDALSRGLWQGQDGTIHVWDDLGALRLEESGLGRELSLAPGLGPGGVKPGARVEAPANLWLLPAQPRVRRINARSVLDPLPFPGAWPFPDSGKGTLLTRTDAKKGTDVTRLDGSRVTHIPPGAGDWPLLLDRRGLVWTQQPGRVFATDSSGRIVATLAVAPGSRVSAAVEDGEGDVWLGTVTDGLFRIRPRVVSVLGATAGLTDDEVLQVTPGGDGSILALVHDGSVIRLGSDGVDTIFVATPDREAYTAMADRRGRIWVSTREHDDFGLLGIAADDTISIPLRVFPNLIREDPNEAGVLWFIAGELFRLRPYAHGGPVLEGPLYTPKLGGRDFLIDPDGVVWIVGPAGMARFSDDGVQEFAAVDGYPLAGARAVHRSSDGTIWIGRYGGGIVRYRDGRFGVVQAADGLWDDVVSTILEDDAGNLWMSSNRGVHRVAHADLDAFLDGRIGRVRGRGYGPEAGFQNAEASGWYGYRSPDGRLWFPTFSGVAVIDPNRVLAREQATPGIRMVAVNAGGRMLGVGPADTLPRGLRRIDIAYGATLLSGQGGIHYEVRLDNVDPDWVDAGRQRQVTYGNLPPGRHIFRVRAISGAGVASAQEATTALVVPAYFYETTAFRLFLALLLAASLWFLYQVRVRQLRAREVRLGRLVDERTLELALSKGETEVALATVEAQAKELRSLDEAKSRFFANVSHELRTPLTLVQGPLQDVLDGRLGPTSEGVREQVATVLASGRRLGELVEQLLDVARLESGEFRLHLREQDLHPLFERLAHAFEALARNRGIAFHASVPHAPIDARVDADQIEKVFANLLANALKFTPAGGRVGFTVDRVLDADRVGIIVTVEDSGPGIPVSEQQRIFERFHQVDDTSKRVHGGAGLGLALVKEIVELHGGSVQVFSEAGHGSRFIVRLPVRGPTEAGSATATPGLETSIEAPSPPGLEPADDTSPTGLEAVGDTSAEHSGDGGGDATVQAATGDAVSVDPDRTEADEAGDSERPTILVVEDHEELRAYLRRHLEERYRVIEASDGRDGLEAARRTAPDLILCDIMMPVMDGEEMCRGIRADPELAFLPVIMLTAKASRQTRLSALEGGADDYLVKPFDPEELRLRIGNALESRRRFAERLLAEGKHVPFVPLELPAAGPARDFATSVDSVLRERMADEDFDVDDMAQALAMSRATLYRKANDELGASPMELLWTFRLKQAAHWLRETDGTVSEIAYACGFKTVPHFTRRFKEQFGATPAAWRRGGVD